MGPIAKRPRGRPPGSGRPKGRAPAAGAPRAKGRGRNSVSGDAVLASTSADATDILPDAMSLLADESAAPANVSLPWGASSVATPNLQDAPTTGAAGGVAAPAAGAPGDEEEGVDEEEDDAEEQMLQMPTATAEDREATKALLDTFSPEQLQRYEVYRRAHLPKSSIRKYLQTVVGGIVPASVGIIVGGCGKLFVGEIVEEALSFMEELGEPENTPIRPDHLREAFRRYRLAHSNSMGTHIHKKQLFRQ
ncbi:hypothetical protein BASA50_002384 [Batrachochytrium salamandrivorans]|uniref:TAFII28-like protein domain-containing protein n=1 Tax=Batrachochytrium salamandrivorans TaxID=1357716 RepID=A0ABQ8FLK5_9FUNG|nr:hypothetical protein BASA60_010776 [Batrachochytrium salamandrivorans]KAH6569580.1 hypothetical protein BASA62_004746 [Batrachochytrium salamandrivorans]KAH6600373.1 hypothetical protein BASA50_002384 [Batrachochytrium salamandrivorans]